MEQTHAFSVYAIENYHVTVLGKKYFFGEKIHSIFQKVVCCIVTKAYSFIGVQISI